MGHGEDHRVGGFERSEGVREAVLVLHRLSVGHGVGGLDGEPERGEPAHHVAARLLRMSGMSSLKVTPSTVTRGAGRPRRSSRRMQVSTTWGAMASLIRRPARTIRDGGPPPAPGG